ncbi:PCMD domain-containing protein [Bacteroides cutis]|uniref:PCMD domain-containing protein n=1 Tax=Bacteroides cutis TaxID=2024197 RepID=UPI000C78F3CE|nr:PCMD domain-containing protein [Bacteroides cutis]
MDKKVYMQVRLGCFLIMAALFSACIENDVPYPYIKLFVTATEVDGQIGSAVISNDDRTVTVNLEDTVNMKKVHVKSITVTEGGRCSLPNDTIIDLSNPYPMTLSLYQDYQWTLKANQTIERRFTVENQVGTAVFNETEHFASVNISTKGNLKTIKLTDLKLGPTGSTVNMSSGIPYLEWEQHGNYAKANVVVNFRDFIVMEEWTLYVFQVETNVVTKSADGWVNVAWLYGEGQENADNGFELKEKDADEWQKVDISYITANGGSFTACVPHLKANTAYTCRAYSGEDKGEEVEFTTGTAIELPNGSFDEWHKTGKVWNPWTESGTQIWDSGNDGATTLGESITIPTSDTWSGAPMGGQAAQLSSKFVGLGSVGKFAAGNLFIGEYIRTDGTNGILGFGKEFTARPTKLKGYYKYTTAPITYLPSKSNTADYNRFLPYQNKPDTCSVYIALGDWENPVEIRTNPRDRKLFDKNDPHVIAYAEFNSGTTVSSYTPLELNLKYNSTSRIPTYLIVVCSASKYGDYFTGAAGATLIIDEFSLEYDY